MVMECKFAIGPFWAMRSTLTIDVVWFYQDLRQVLLAKP